MVSQTPADRLQHLLGGSTYTVKSVEIHRHDVTVQLTEGGKEYFITGKSVDLVRYLRGADYKQADASAWLNQAGILLLQLGAHPEIDQIAFDPDAHSMTFSHKDEEPHTFHFNQTTPSEVHALSDNAVYLERKNDLTKSENILSKERKDLKATKTSYRSFTNYTVNKQDSILYQQQTSLIKEIKTLNFLHVAATITQAVAGHLKIALPPPSTAAIDPHDQGHMQDFFLDKHPTDLRNLNLSNLSPIEFHQIPFSHVRFTTSSINMVDWDSYFNANNDLSNFPLTKFVALPGKPPTQAELSSRLTILLASAAENGCDISSIPWNQLSKDEYEQILKKLNYNILGPTTTKILFDILRTRVDLPKLLDECYFFQNLNFEDFAQDIKANPTPDEIKNYFIDLVAPGEPNRVVKLLSNWNLPPIKNPNLIEMLIDWCPKILNLNDPLKKQTDLERKIAIQEALNIENESRTAFHADFGRQHFIINTHTKGLSTAEHFEHNPLRPNNPNTLAAHEVEDLFKTSSTNGDVWIVPLMGACSQITGTTFGQFGASFIENNPGYGISEKNSVKELNIIKDKNNNIIRIDVIFIVRANLTVIDTATTIDRTPPLIEFQTNFSISNIDGVFVVNPFTTKHTLNTR